MNKFNRKKLVDRCIQSITQVANTNSPEDTQFTAERVETILSCIHDFEYSYLRESCMNCKASKEHIKFLNVIDKAYVAGLDDAYVFEKEEIGGKDNC